MENSKRFLNAFINIEMRLKEILKINHLPFTQLVSRAAKINEVVKYYEFDLIEYSQLRNAITHNRIGSRDEVIAEPHLKVVEEIETIDKALSAPKLLLERFKHDVLYADKTDPLSEVIAKKRKTGYSVVPIYDDHYYVGTITDTMIAMWIEDQYDNLNTQEFTIPELLAYHKKNERVVFVGTETTLFEALSIFTKRYHDGHRVAAIIITPNGSMNQLPLGVLTLADLPALLHELA